MTKIISKIVFLLAENNKIWLIALWIKSSGGGGKGGGDEAVDHGGLR